VALFNGKFKLGNRKSRSGRKSNNNLGIVQVDRTPSTAVRDRRLDILDMYLSGSQYDHLVPWDEATCSKEYVPIMQRQPKVNFNFAKLLSCRVSAKLFGASVWPSFKVEDDEDMEEYIRFIHNASKLGRVMTDAGKLMGAHGSVFVRFKAVMGKFKLETYKSKWCFPEFTPSGELQKVRIQYVFTDQEDKDDKGNPKDKWFRLDLGQLTDTLWDNPEFDENIEEPDFTVVESVDHNLGFVQGEWMKTGDEPFSPDGPSLIEDILPFIDSLNYNLSQSDQAIAYNQDPQVTFSGMDEDDINRLIVRSSQKSWNLGKAGKAEILETTLEGPQRASEFRTDIRLNIQDLARVVLLDPEKMVAHAQSGKAMEVLHGPFIELIDELRPIVEDPIRNLTIKMALTNLVLVQRGEPAPVEVPPGFSPKSFNIEIMWPPVFPQTMEDLLKKVQVASQATSASIISRKTGTRFVAKDFGVEDVEAEQAEIDAQPVLNPFGSF